MSEHERQRKPTSGRSAGGVNLCEGATLLLAVGAEDSAALTTHTDGRLSLGEWVPLSGIGGKL
jgi:hypothetical protein